MVRCRAGASRLPAGQQRQPRLQPRQQRRGRQDLDARRGQLDGERQAVEPLTDGGDRTGVLRREHKLRLYGMRALHKEGHGGTTLHLLYGHRPVTGGQGQGV